MAKIIQAVHKYKIYIFHLLSEFMATVNKERLLNKAQHLTFGTLLVLSEDSLWARY